MFNYLYADIVSLMDPVSLKKIMTGAVGDASSHSRIFVGSRNIDGDCDAMVLLSRVLKYGANRWANIIIGVLHTAAVSHQCCWNNASSLLPVFWDHRNCLHFVHCLVRMDVD